MQVKKSFCSERSLQNPITTPYRPLPLQTSHEKFVAVFLFAGTQKAEPKRIFTVFKFS